MSSNMSWRIIFGFYDTVKNEGWGGIRARDAGNMVKRAIEIAEQQMAAQNQNNR